MKFKINLSIFENQKETVYSSINFELNKNKCFHINHKINQIFLDLFHFYYKKKYYKI